MSQVDFDIRAAIAAYTSAFTASKPTITTRVFGDGEVQLFLNDSSAVAPRTTHAQGQGKTIEEAATQLKAHLARRLAEIHAENEKDTAELVAKRSEFRTRLNAAIMAVAAVPATEVEAAEKAT